MYENKSLTGLLAGLSFRMKIKDRHYLYTELLYSMRGESHGYTTSQLNGYSVTSLTNGSGSIAYYLDYRTHYIEIPLMYSIDLMHRALNDRPVHLFISSGLSAGINVVSKLAQNSFSISSPGSTFSAIDEHVQVTKIPEANPVILNFVTDVEAEFRRKKAIKYFVYGRFNQSLTHVFKSEFVDMKTKVMTLGFGFGIRRNFG